ncbi:hypothetical protein BHYA_0365g00030 [Botrytis hyacinthi]|uniref:Rhodopsin domain-containing protein n=1 Tax=Botrytis hyacinthi TaxID=278943 RepID=A0A4Z1GD18_9HELO|nr:hypothetical protein BHYA_0365g00030 [Botrytis hyacinthi]
MSPLVFRRAEAIGVTQIPSSVLVGIGIIPPLPGVAPNLWAWSDIAFTLAVLATVASFVNILIRATGFGRTGIHSWDASVYKSISLRSHTSIALGILLPPMSIGLIKITIFLMYLEVFAFLKVMQILCYIGIGITTMFYTIITVLDAVWAFPLSRYYNAMNTQKAQTLNLPKGIFSLTSDIFLLVVPVVAVSKINLMTTRKKYRVLESVKRSERSTEGDPSQDRKSRKLYPGLDVTTVGGTALDNKANEEAETEQFSTERQYTAQCPRNVLGRATGDI